MAVPILTTEAFLNTIPKTFVVSEKIFFLIFHSKNLHSGLLTYICNVPEGFDKFELGSPNNYSGEVSLKRPQRFSRRNRLKKHVTNVSTDNAHYGICKVPMSNM